MLAYRWGALLKLDLLRDDDSESGGGRRPVRLGKEGVHHVKKFEEKNDKTSSVVICLAGWKDSGCLRAVSTYQNNSWPATLLAIFKNAVINEEKGMAAVQNRVLYQ